MLRPSLRKEQVPAHVEARSVFDLDIFRDSGLLGDPYRRVEEIIREAPEIFWSPLNGGHWVATGYAIAREIMSDPQTFASNPFTEAVLRQLQQVGGPNAPRPAKILVLTDPPEHPKLRAPLQKAFGPQAIAVKKQEMQDTAWELIGRIAARGQSDFIADVAKPFPVRMFLKLMGLPEERLETLHYLVDKIFAPEPDDGDPMRHGVMRKVNEAMEDVLLTRRDNPGDDLISRLWQTEIDGQSVTHETMQDYSVGLLIAGVDTVKNAIGFGMRYLADRPDLQATLKANPPLIVKAVEEMLRLHTLGIPWRRATRDVTVGGSVVKEGETIILYLPAANLDPSVFSSPMALDLDRNDRTHLAFGMGPHMCIGASLARLQLQAVFGAALQHLTPFRLDPDKAASFRAGYNLSIHSLPLCWNGKS